jgi:hypothetical protein
MDLTYICSPIPVVVKDSTFKIVKYIDITQVQVGYINISQKQSLCNILS